MVRYGGNYGSHACRLLIEPCDVLAGFADHCFVDFDDLAFAKLEMQVRIVGFVVEPAVSGVKSVQCSGILS